MHIERLGEHGPDLVLIHGWAMHAGIFAPLLDALAGCYRLHLVDLPGHGRSRDDHSRLELAAIGDAIAARVPNAIWLGWSLGGLVALSAAVRLPQAVRGLVMLCASPRFVEASDWPHGVALRVFSDFERGLRHDYRATIDRFLALEAHGSDHMRDALRVLREQVFAHGEPQPQALNDGLHLLEHSDLRAALPSLNVPSLWLAGRRDRLVAWQAMRDAAARCRDAHCHCIAGAGHAPFLAYAAEVASAIETFTDRLP
ncbi:MAG: pimeloyl-[acyl-carrier protein] methyl ester esterase [Gammaproteobacteria bacterium HGW-Gammaproteobacteria-4]|jgi:pimeloyl-[acyl-carrier protein] methyl ester esterase|nr:MAG: pimeloyl-[acyl-carrier protein] methyl ester esterase [Gammaproteobacteria bacterium HGW-Gammaproteobacteria-4]